jgi:cation diffusion facilitator CzcD-associated flavoprotein CzcO
VSTRSPTTQVEVAIVGAGLSGLGMAIALRRAGREDFVVLERENALGGTWRDNSYPGCACDIPSVLYSYRDEPNPDWTRAFALQPEIWAYMRRVADAHDVQRFMRFNHDVVDARFDGEHQRWEIETTGGRYTAAVLISAAGTLADPSIPDLTGLGSFTGTVFHSSRWNHEHPLEGRRVAVIGSGASALQFVPEIQPRVAHLTLFQRTPTWVLPRQNIFVPRTWRERFARHPWLESLARAGAFSFQEASHIGFSHPAVMRVAELQARRQLARQVSDPELRARLTPTFRLGCKRVLFSNRWYPALVADNAEVVSASIREVVADGIIDSADVHHALDTIVLATGFRATDPPIAQRLRDRDGRRLAEHWNGSPRAHLGMGVAEYPNLFFLLGPNTTLGHNSVLLMIEAQIGYLIKLLAHRDRVGAATVAPTAQAQAGSVAEIDRGTEGSVWSAGGCISWYLDATGRNSALWPGSVRAYQRRLAQLDPDDYSWQPPRAMPAGVDVESALV